MLLLRRQHRVQFRERGGADGGQLALLSSLSCRKLLDLIRVTALDRRLQRLASLPQLLPHWLGGLTGFTKYSLCLRSLGRRQIQIVGHFSQPVPALRLRGRLRGLSEEAGGAERRHGGPGGKFGWKDLHLFRSPNHQNENARNRFSLTDTKTD